MASEVKRVMFSVSRPSEYTSWRPRVDRGVCFTAVVWGVFCLEWEVNVRTAVSPADVNKRVSGTGKSSHGVKTDE